MKQGLYTDGDGNQRWYFIDQLHRDDGPAVIYTNGNKRWYVNDKLHRLNGPVIEWSTGHNEWWINGLWISDNFQDFQNHLIKHNIKSIL